MGVGREEKEIRGLKSSHSVYRSFLKYASIVWALGHGLLIFKTVIC